MYSSIFITISIIFDNILEAQVGDHVARGERARATSRPRASRHDALRTAEPIPRDARAMAGGGAWCVLHTCGEAACGAADARSMSARERR